MHSLVHNIRLVCLASAPADFLGDQVTMIYHVPVKQPWIDAAKALRQRLKDACPALKVDLPQVIGEHNC
jgi:hypothetical protein